MEPNIKTGETIFLSKLVKPDRFDVIAFNYDDAYFGNVNWVYRVCGIPGDTVEIRNGVLYVNGANADSGLVLKQEYSVLKWQAESLETDQDVAASANHTDTAIISTTSTILKEKDIAANRFILPAGYADPDIIKWYLKPWNQDHFGPLKVPGGKYFLLGDNRHHARDSRYIGFVDKESFRGTLIW